MRTGRTQPRPLFVLEVNEVPLRIYQAYVTRRPRSALASLLQRALTLETLADDVPQDFLFPAQTWASMNMGVPYELHRVHWFNDPKPERYPLYWQIVERHGFSIGLAGTPHSSPASRHARSSNVRFLIPDCFAPDEQTKPAKYRAFQRLNVRQTSAQRRVAGIRIPVSRCEFDFLLSVPRLGIRARTVRDTATTLARIAAAGENPERLRNLQFLLLKDIFLDCLRSHKVHLATIFTNHVAAMMHRYWYALFPQDYRTPLYDDAWVDRYRGEIFHALDLLDPFVGEMMDWCARTEGTLLVLSGMGQCANDRLEKAPRYQVVIGSLERFLAALGVEAGSWHPAAAMEPQYTLLFRDESSCDRADATLRAAEGDGLKLEPERRGTVLTFSLRADSERDFFDVRGRRMAVEDLGLRRIPISNTHAAHHHPAGVLLAYGSPTSEARNRQVSYLEVAPAICAYFGIPRPEYMRTPTFRL